MAFFSLRRAVCAAAIAVSSAFGLSAAAQPTLVADIRPGPLTSVPRGFQVMGGTLYFTAERSDVGAEPFLYNGQYVALATNVETAPGQGSNPEGGYVSHKGAVYFVAAVADSPNGETGLWRFDGRETVLVWRGSTPSFPTSFGGDLYFVARHPTAGGAARVWRWDGHDNYLVHAIPQGTTDPRHLAVLKGSLYFSHDTSGTGPRLWRFDGRTASVLASFAPVPAVTEPRCGAPQYDFLKAYDGHLYFTAPDYRLYRYDGAAAPVALADGRPKWSGGFGGTVYYTTGTRVTICGGHPQHTLWGYDGAPRKITTLMAFGEGITDTGTGYQAGAEFVPFRRALYYRSATDLWRLTATHFERVSDVGLRGNDVPGLALAPYKGRLFFGFPLGEAFNEELFSYDGRGPVYERIAVGQPAAMNMALFDAEATALEHGLDIGTTPTASDDGGVVADGGVALALVSANPARTSARVRLTLAIAAEARVAVYDAIGREVARLHDGPLAGGTTDLAWSASAVASGVYTVRADVGGRGASLRVVKR